jgi:hypothetical protein
MSEKSILGSTPWLNRFIPKGDQVDIAGPLAMAEEAALDTVGAGHLGELGCGDAGAAVVVRVHRDADVLAVADVAAEVLDLVAVGVRGAHLHGGRQVEDDLAALGGLPDVHHRVAHLQGEVGGGLGEDLRGVLVAELDVVEVLLGVLHDPLGAPVRQVDALLLVHVEDDAAEQFGGRVVHVDGGAVGADQALGGAIDEILAGLGQHRDGDVIGDQVLLDELAHEVVLGLGGRREADLDLLVAHRGEQAEHPELAGDGHRVDEGLVAVAQVGGQPPGSLVQLLVGPGAIGQRTGGRRACTGRPASVRSTGRERAVGGSLRDLLKGLLDIRWAAEVPAARGLPVNGPRCGT